MNFRALLGIARPETLQSGLPGFVGSMIFAFAVVILAGLMNRYLKLRLKI